MKPSSIAAILGVSFIALVSACSSNADDPGDTSPDTTDDAGGTPQTNGGDTDDDGTPGTNDDGNTPGDKDGGKTPGDKDGGETGPVQDGGHDAEPPPSACATPPCADGEACVVPGDCVSKVCNDHACAVPTATDGVQNGTETGIDCGGGAPTNAPRCAAGQGCAGPTDCDSLSCAGTCKAPTKTDGIKNGTETDTDCGGGAPTNAPRCAVDKACTTHDDCGSSACAITGPKAGKCIAAKSCVNYLGGYTCGKGTDLGLNETDEYESCCDTAPLAGTATKIDRFAITAGRMRAFIERLNGDVRAWATAHPPAGWKTTSNVLPDVEKTPSTKSYKWLDLLPNDKAMADTVLGPYWANAPNDPNDTARSQETPHSKRSCGSGSYNGHTYWVGADTESAAAQFFTKDQLDPKVLNCVPWHLVKAFCAWDGGHLATAAELNNAYTNGGTSARPWGYAGSLYNQPYEATVYYEEIGGKDFPQDDRLNHNFRYGFPGERPANKVITWWLSPPGRFWKGWNKNKVEIDGNGLEWTGDYEYAMVWKQSFEHHKGHVGAAEDWRSQLPDDGWPRADVPNGYYAVNARCAYP